MLLVAWGSAVPWARASAAPATPLWVSCSPASIPKPRSSPNSDSQQRLPPPPLTRPPPILWAPPQASGQGRLQAAGSHVSRVSRPTVPQTTPPRALPAPESARTPVCGSPVPARGSSLLTPHPHSIPRDPHRAVLLSCPQACPCPHLDTEHCPPSPRPVLSSSLGPGPRRFPTACHHLPALGRRPAFLGPGSFRHHFPSEFPLMTPAFCTS